METLLSTETMQVVKEKLGEVTEVAVNLSRRYKLVLIGTGAVVGLYWYLTRNHGFFRKLGIPGPNPGLFGAFSGYQEKGIHGFDMEMMKKYGKIVGIYHGAQPVYLIGDAEMIRQIKVKEFQTFVNLNSSAFPTDPVLKDSLIMATDDHWKFMRSILSPTFTSGRMRDMTPLIQKCVDVLLKNLSTLSEEGAKSMKMRDVFSMFTLDVIFSVCSLSTAFGVEVDCQKDSDNPFMKNAKKLMIPGAKMWGIYILCSLFPFMKDLMEKMGVRSMDTDAGDFFVNAVHGVIHDRKEHSVTRSDFLQLMMNSNKLEEDREDPETHLEFDKSKRRGMTKSEIVGNALIFLLGGFETTSHALSFMAYNLATNPECQEKLIEEIDRVLNGKPPDYNSILQLQYLENVFLQTLRLFPPAPRTTRIGSEDIEINGYLIKKGVEVHFPVAAIHRDPDYWRDPENFDPDRFLPENRPENYSYIFQAFGAGPRSCIGMRLAHMEVKMVIAGILQKYRFKPAPETKAYAACSMKNAWKWVRHGPASKPSSSYKRRKPMIPPELDKTQMKPVDGMVLMIDKQRDAQ